MKRLFICTSCGKQVSLDVDSDERPNACSRCWAKWHAVEFGSLAASPDTMAQPPRSWPPNTGCDPASSEQTVARETGDRQRFGVVAMESLSYPDRENASKESPSGQNAVLSFTRVVHYPYNDRNMLPPGLPIACLRPCLDGTQTAMSRRITTKEDMTDADTQDP